MREAGSDNQERTQKKRQQCWRGDLSVNADCTKRLIILLSHYRISYPGYFMPITGRSYKPSDMFP